MDNRNRKRIGLRILADIILLISVFTLPWWLVFVLTSLALVYFSKYFEAILVAVFIDMAYYVPGASFAILNLSFPVTLFAIVIVFIFEVFLKSRIRIYDQ